VLVLDERLLATYIRCPDKSVFGPGLVVAAVPPIEPPSLSGKIDRQLQQSISGSNLCYSGSREQGT
jgi:hypothetical protein